MLEHLKADLGLDKGRQILHTAQSLFHDHVAGARTSASPPAWIDRRKGQEGWGATMPPPEAVRTDFHFASMAEFAAAHRGELGRGTLIIVSLSRRGGTNRR